MCQAPKERQVPGGIKNIKASPGAVKKRIADALYPQWPSLRSRVPSCQCIKKCLGPFHKLHYCTVQSLTLEI